MSLFFNSLLLSVPAFSKKCRGKDCIVEEVAPKVKHTHTEHVSTHTSSSNIISDPIRSCSQGFYYDEVADCCTRELMVDALLSCVGVGGVLENGACKCLTGQHVSCPSGYRFHAESNECITTEMTPMIPSCAGVPDSELTADGRKCIFEVEVEPRLRCPDGSRLVGDVCIGHRDLPSEYTTYTCPSGWHRVGTDMCERLEEVTCDHVSVKAPSCSVECPDMTDFQPCLDPCRVTKKVSHHHGRKLCTDDDCVDLGYPADALCEVAFCQMHLGLPDLPSTDLLANNTCTRTTHMKAKPYCSVGEHHKGRCVEELISTPMVECPKGCKTIDGKCMKAKSLSTEFVCPMGFEVQCKKPGASVHPSKCECVAEESIEAMYECLDGGEYMPSGECMYMRPADLYCSDADFMLSNGVCVGREHEPVRLEYIVSYVTEKPCELDECIKSRVPIVKKSVRSKHVSVGVDGQTSTRCDVETCVSASGDVLMPGKKYNKYPEALLEEAEDYYPEEYPSMSPDQLMEGAMELDQEDILLYSDEDVDAQYDIYHYYADSEYMADETTNAPGKESL